MRGREYGSYAMKLRPTGAPALGRTLRNAQMVM
jgi:hypothetical protein